MQQTGNNVAGSDVVERSWSDILVRDLSHLPGKNRDPQVADLDLASLITVRWASTRWRS